MKSKEYTLGFAFSADKQQLVLIQKLRPEWQNGFFNGVGGKVEKYDANIYAAMTREFEEETGVKTTQDEWTSFGEMIFENDIMEGKAVVHLFRMFSDKVFDCRTVEEEVIYMFNVTDDIYSTLPDLSSAAILKNLKVLIPMALDEDFMLCHLNIK